MYSKNGLPSFFVKSYNISFKSRKKLITKILCENENYINQKVCFQIMNDDRSNFILVRERILFSIEGI